MTSWREAMKGMGLVLAGGLLLSGCTPDFAEQGEAPVLLVVTNIAGQSGGGGAGSGIASVLFADVRTDTGSTFNDNATITVAVESKNPRAATSASPFNDVVLEQYRVTFRRTDGLNREGVDVPFSFSGPVSLRVPVGATGTASIVIVRHTAKLESPLSNVRRFGGLDILTTFAEITVFGRTIAGDAVEASGRLEVHFADFGG